MSSARSRNRLRPAASPGTTGMALAPYLFNILVGDTPTIEALNLSGQPVTGLTWTSSNINVVTVSSVDPTVLNAVGVGQATITAGTATALVTVAAAGVTPAIGVWPPNGCNSPAYDPTNPQVTFCGTGVKDFDDLISTGFVRTQKMFVNLPKMRRYQVQIYPCTAANKFGPPVWENLLSAPGTSISVNGDPGSKTIRTCTQ